MNEEIQQTVIENKKPRMYVSWKIIILDVVLITLALLLIGKLPLAFDTGSHHIMDSYFFLVPGLLILVVAFIITVISSFFEKPIGYVKTRGINFWLFFSVLTTIVIILWLTPYHECGLLSSGIVCPSNAFLDYLNRLSLFSSPLASLIISTGAAMYLNTRFRKTESELNLN